MKKIDELLNNLEIKTEEIEIKFNGESIKVKGYLPYEEKRNLVNWVISQNRRNVYTNLLDEFDLNKKFDIALVNYYTDYEFGFDYKNDRYNEIYDILNSNQFFDIIIAAIPEEEYNNLKSCLERRIEEENKYCYTISGSIKKILDQLNFSLDSTNNVLEKMNNFDLKDYDMIKELATKLGYDDSKMVLDAIENKDK